MATVMRKCYLCGKVLYEQDAWAYVKDFEQLEVEFVHGECIEKEEDE
jgi:hypothetical protein